MSEKEIIKKLDTIIALLAIQGKKDKQQLKILKSLGFPYSEISKLLGIPEGILKSRDHRKKQTRKQGSILNQNKETPLTEIILNGEKFAENHPNGKTILRATNGIKNYKQIALEYAFYFDLLGIKKQSF